MRGTAHKLTFIALLAAMVSLAIAQPPDVLWTYHFGGADTLIGDVREISDENFLVGGGDMFEDPFLFKISSSGELMWGRSYFGFGGEFKRVLELSDGGFLIAGTKAGDSSNGYRACPRLISTNAIGDTLWTRIYDDTSYTSGVDDFLVNPSGGYLFVGTRVHRDSTYWFQRRPFCAQLDANFDIVWTRSWYISNRLLGLTAAYGADGNIALGLREFWDGNLPYPLPTIMGIGPNGDSLWFRQYPWRCGDGAYFSGLCANEDGYVMSGSAAWHTPVRAYIAGLDLAGDTLWFHSIDFPSDTDSAFYAGAQILPGGGYIVSGTVLRYSPQPQLDASLVRVDSVGDTLWSKDLSVSGNDTYGGAVRTNDNGYLFVRQTVPNNGADIIRLAPDPTLAAGKNFIPHPSSVSLSAYPNPFNATTTIIYEIPRPGDVRLAVFDVTGRNVKTLKEGKMEPGRYEARWDAGSLPSGIYFVRLEASQRIMTQKILLIK